MHYEQKKIDWDKLKTEYATTDISTRELAKKYDVSYSTLRQRATNEKWVEARRNFSSNIVAKATQKVANKKSNDLSKELHCADELINIIEKGIARGDFTTEGNFAVDNINKAANALTKLLDIKRIIQGHQTITEKQKYELEKARLELEKEKASKNDAMDTNIEVVFDNGIEDYTV